MLCLCVSVMLQYDCSDGIMDGVSAGKVVVDCATLAPAFMQAIDQRVADKGGLFLEAPVSGEEWRELACVYFPVHDDRFLLPSRQQRTRRPRVSHLPLRRKLGTNRVHCMCCSSVHPPAPYAHSMLSLRRLSSKPTRSSCCSWERQPTSLALLARETK